jgi:hypothetical protein
MDTTQAASTVPVLHQVISLILVVALGCLVWWIGKVTRVWRLMRRIRAAWTSGLVDPGLCQWYGCSAEAQRYARFCGRHAHEAAMRARSR